MVDVLLTRCDPRQEIRRHTPVEPLPVLGSHLPFETREFRFEVPPSLPKLPLD